MVADDSQRIALILMGIGLALLTLAVALLGFP
jgi:hypothetical protein